jgi:hypothetical protein
MDVTDESRSGDSALLTALKAALARVISAIRAFGATLPDQTGTPRTEVRWFGDYEKVEEAKYYPPVPPSLAGDGDLLDWSGRPGVTLLAVDPYLLYVYWDFDLAKLPPDTTAAVLRFYDGASHFDVDVDLRTRNWYVPLRNPARTYYADLSAITAAGKLVPLVRSNTIQTSRAWPVAAVEHGFVSGAAAAEQFKELLPPPPPPFRSEDGGILEIARRSDASPTAPGSPPAAETPEAEAAERPVSIVAAPPTERHVPKPPDAAETLRRRLSEIYESRQWQPHSPGAAVEQQAVSPLPVTADLPNDLTARVERQFSPGLSSFPPGARGPRKPAG